MMMEAKKETINTEENHYEEFHVNDFSKNASEEVETQPSKEDTTKSEGENKKFSNLLNLKNLKFKDSGVDLPNILNEYEEKKSKLKEIIPQFYFPKGTKYSNISNEEYLNQIKKKVKSVFNNKALNETEFNNVTNKCNLPKYLNGALFRKVLKYAKNKNGKETNINNYDSDDNSTIVGDDDANQNIQRSSSKLSSKNSAKKQIPLKLIQLENKLKELKQFNLENCIIPSDSVVSFEDFIEYWENIAKDSQDIYYISFYILKDEDNTDKLRNYLDYLVPSDFMVVLNDVVKYHPGLKFLLNMPIFQQRYSESVIEQLFYHKPQNWNRKMTLNEFRNSKFLEHLLYLQIDDDINIHRNLFSYKHFYVIYCKFWELDKDHDMKINRNELAKYDQFSITPIMIDRVIEGYGKVTSNVGEIIKSGWRDKINDQKLNSNIPKVDNFSSLQEAFRNASIKNKNLIFGNLIKNYNREDDPNIMLYKDFIWFILSTEDKGTTQAIEYWFRCLDLDGDGMISVFEIEQFWIEQYQRMIEWRTVDIWSFNDFLCYLLDMIQPENKNVITLADLKRSKNTPLFFDMLFDIKKYEMHLRCMDPLFREANEVWIVEGISSDNINIDEEEKKIKLEGWEKFAERTYEQLAYEEMQAQQYQLSCQNYQMHKGKLVDSSYRHHRNSILDEDPFGPEIIDDFLEEDEEYSICSEDDGEEEMNYTSLDQNSNLINKNINFDNYKEIEESTKKLKI